MAYVFKFLALIVLIALVDGQSRSKQKTVSSTASTAGKTRYSSAAEQGRTLGLLGPLLRLGLGRPSRTGLQSDTSSSALADPAYGGYNGYGGYAGAYPNPYASYANYGQYAGYPGVGYGGGYRPPVAYPQYNGYTSPYQQQNYAGLNALSSLATTANSQSNSLSPGLAGGNAANAAQQAQLATVLGQALGSSLRPLLSGAGGGRFGTAAAATGAGAGGGNALAGLFSLLG